MSTSFASAILNADILIYFTGALVSIFSIVNPFIAAPVFISLTADITHKEQTKIAQRAAINVCAILLLFFISGSLILNLFGISFNALRIGGGLMIITSAYGMLNKKEKLLPEERLEAEGKEDIAFSPLAMPIMSGPGAIAVIIGLTTEATTWYHYVAIVAAIFVVSLVCFITLNVSNALMAKLGNTLLKAFTRIMGFLLLCIGVQFIVNGFEGVILHVLSK